MSESSKDCWQCRLISGGGLLAGGVYVVYHGKKLKSFSNQVVCALGYGLGVLGLLRMFALPPFKSHSQLAEPARVEEREENEYIIGKFPSKFQ